MSGPSFEETVSAILQDPQQLQKIIALAQSFGASPPAPEILPAPSAPSAAQKAPPTEQAPHTEALSDLLQQAGKLDRRQENLLNALKPFLKPERREKIDRAMQAARISRLAGAALRSRDQKQP